VKHPVYKTAAAKTWHRQTTTVGENSCQIKTTAVFSSDGKQ